MRTKRVLVVLTMLALASPLGAQMGMGPRTPDMSGVWHPVVGSGGAYEMTDRDGKKSQMEITIVGKEDVSGKTGFWMEMAMASPRSGGDMYMKYLIAPSDKGDGFHADDHAAARPGPHGNGHEHDDGAPHAAIDAV